MSTTLKFAEKDHKGLLTVARASGNQLLKDLLTPFEIREYLLPQLKLVTFERNQVVYEQGDSIEHLYFPLDSIASTLAIMEDGSTLETTMIGCEGVIGISAILGTGKSRQWMWVLISGSAVQLEAKALEKVVQNDATLKTILRGYRSLISQLSQRSVCNSRHTILERLSCWLLMVHDRVGGEDLRLTQELIASRLGARRAGVTVAAGVLQSMQGIEYRRGQLHIKNRQVLESTACECYSVLRSELIPPSSIRPSHYR
jgi:CRP-like cAMP-binding protein